ncbi:MAG: MFS transporter [Candidatus Hodarchaeales archaeon]|jgi:MFS family permease
MLEKTLNHIFLSLSSFWALVFFRRGLFYSFLSIYLHFYLGMSITEATLFGTTGMVSSGLFQSFVWNKAADNIFNRKILIVWGEVLAALGYILIWFLHVQVYHQIAPITAGWVITFGLFVVEAFWSASNVGWAAIIADVTPGDERSSLMGRLSAVGGVGRMAGAGAAASLYGFGGFNGWGFFSGALFFISALAIVSSAIVIQIFIKDDDLVYRYDVINPLKSESINNQSIAFDKQFYFLLIIGLAAINLGRNAVVLIKNLFLIERFNASNELIGTLEILASVSTVLTGLMTPYLVKKIGDWHLYLVSISCAIIALIGFVIMPYIGLVLLMLIMFQFVMVTIRATTYSIVSNLVPAEVRGRYFGYYNTVFFLSFGLGGTLYAAPLIDILQALGYDVIFAYQVSFFVSAILVVSGLGLTLLLYKRSQFLKKTQKSILKSLI